MGPFLTISRHEVVELAHPWDPERIVGEYLDYRHEQSAAPSPEEVAALADGGILRFDLEHQRIGSVEAELHLDVLDPLHVQADLAAQVGLHWWLRPIALPFRPRLRRWINARVDEMLDELAKDGPPADGETTEAPATDETRTSPAPSNARWTVRILTPSGKSVYQHTEGAIESEVRQPRSAG